MTPHLRRHGRHRLADFPLTPGIAYLNHGSFGATPHEVTAAQARWRDRIEANPTRFMTLEFPALIREAAGAVGAFLGGSAGDWAFVENATSGANAVIASLALRPGERILTTGHVYGAVRNAMRHHAARAGAIYDEVPVPVPYPGDDALLERVAAAIGRDTRLAVFDHISSHPATLLPVERLARLCRERNVPVLIDGAHAPGQIPLDVPALGVDWYVANLHKWAFAPRSAGVIYAADGRRADLHPAVISHPYGQGFPAEFDWTGTRDFTAWLSASEGIAYWRREGGPALMERNRRLAAEAADALAAAWGTEIAAPAGHRAAMATIRLPLGGPATAERARRLYAHLVTEHDIVAPIFCLDGGLWIRIGAQIYNDLADYMKLPDAVAALARLRT